MKKVVRALKREYAMLKVKLYQTGNFLSKTTFYDCLRQNLYSDENGCGFELLDDSENNFVAQFIERTVRKQQFELPDGAISEIETVSYIKVKFGIRFDTKYALYIINPPKNVKYVFEMVKPLFGSNNGLKPIDLDLKKLLEMLHTKYECLIKSMSLSNIQCDANTVAKTKIISTKNLNLFYLKNYSNTSAVIDTVHMLIDDIDTELSRTGRFRIPEQKLQTFLYILDHFPSE